MHLENYPSLRPPTVFTDEPEKQVRSALVRVKGLDSGSVVVVANGSVVTLGGSVPDASQIPTAVSAAQGVKGVSEVHNSLTIKARGQ